MDCSSADRIQLEGEIQNSTASHSVRHNPRPTMDAFRVLQPTAYAHHFLSSGVRPHDGSALDAFRATSLTVNAIDTCAGSAAVRMGATSVFVGVTCSLVAPSSSPLLRDLLAVDVKLPPIAAARFRQPRLGSLDGKRHAVVADMVRDVLVGGGALSLNELGVARGASADASSDSVSVSAKGGPSPAGHWKLNIDVVCTAFDGNLEDAVLSAVVGALGTLTLPGVTKKSVDAPWKVVSGPTALPQLRPDGVSHWEAHRRLALLRIPVAASHIVVVSVNVRTAIGGSVGSTGGAAASATGDAAAQNEEGEEEGHDGDSSGALAAAGPTPGTHILISDPSATLEDIAAARVTVVVDGGAVQDGGGCRPVLGVFSSGHVPLSMALLATCVAAAQRRCVVLCDGLRAAGIPAGVTRT